MKTLDEVLLLAAPTVRAAAYLARFAAAGRRPRRVLLLATPPIPRSAGILPPSGPYLPEALRLDFDPARGVAERAAGSGIPIAPLTAWDPNDEEVRGRLAEAPERVVLFAGPGGAILRRDLFTTGKVFLHAHPGRLPEFRGSTPIHYQVLEEGRLEISVLILSPELDGGEVLAILPFPLPAEPEWTDHYYDPLYRAEAMMRILPRFLAGELRSIPQEREKARTFRVIHPVLRHLAIARARRSRP